MKELKGYSRSVRMTNTVRDFVLEQNGNGFNEKFENLVLYCKKKLPEIDKQIKEKEKQLARMNDKISNLQNITTEIDSLKFSIDAAIKRAKKISGE